MWKFSSGILIILSFFLSSFSADAANDDRYALRGPIAANPSLTSETERQFGVRLRRKKQHLVQQQAPEATSAKPQIMRQHAPVALSPYPVAVRKPASLMPVSNSETSDSEETEDSNPAPPTHKTPSVDSDDDEEGAEADDDGEDGEEDESGTVEAKLAASIGYDTNPDEDPQATGSAFHRYDAEIKSTYNLDGINLEVAGTATIIDVIKRENFSRWEAAISAEAEREFRKGLTGTMGIELRHDALTEDDRSTESGAFAKLDYKNSLIGASLLGALDFKVDSASPASTAEEDREPRMETRKTSIEAEISLRPESMLSPYLRVGFVDVARPGQDIEAEDLNAFGRLAVAGIRYTPSEKFKFDIGARFEDRDFDADELNDSEFVFADIGFTWTPSSQWEITGNLRQRFEDPDSGGSSFVQSTTYGLGVEWKPSEQMELALQVGSEDSVDIDEGTKTQEVTLEILASHELSKNLGAFVAMEQTWSIAQTPTDDFERTQVRAGLEFKM